MPIIEISFVLYSSSPVQRQFFDMGIPPLFYMLCKS